MKFKLPFSNVIYNRMFPSDGQVLLAFDYTEGKGKVSSVQANTILFNGKGWEFDRHQVLADHPFIMMRVRHPTKISPQEYYGEIKDNVFIARDI